MKRLIAVVALVAFALALALAAPHKALAADSTLRVSCNVWATVHVDPIRLTDHDHLLMGNKSLSNTSTYDSLVNTTAGTSCEASYLTSAFWDPRVKNEASPKGILYYGDPSDQAIKFPEGIQLVADSAHVFYTCGSSPGNTAPHTDTPPYGCADNWGAHIRMPTCYDGSGVLTPEHTVYPLNGSRTDCDTDHPVHLIEITIDQTHPNTDGVVPNPLEISCGTNQWCDFHSMHGDYWFAPQAQFNSNVDLDGDGKIELRDADGNGKYQPWLASGDSEQNLADLCILNGFNIEFANARCRPGGLQSWQITNLKNAVANGTVY